MPLVLERHRVGDCRRISFHFESINPWVDPSPPPPASMSWDDGSRTLLGQPLDRRSCQQGVLRGPSMEESARFTLLITRRSYCREYGSGSVTDGEASRTSRGLRDAGFGRPDRRLCTRSVPLPTQLIGLPASDLWAREIEPGWRHARQLSRPERLFAAWHYPIRRDRLWSRQADRWRSEFKADAISVLTISTRGMRVHRLDRPTGRHALTD